MRTAIFSLVGALACIVSTTSYAEVSFDFNAARSEKTWGGELGVGYSVLSVGGFRVTPGAGAFLYKGDNDRYYMDNNGGNPRCRDSDTGQYAASEKCDNLAVKAYGRVEMTYTTPTSFTLGVGGRYFTGDFRPYGTLALPLAPRISLKANAGSKYFSAGLLARF